jgi:site-specific DNA-methyltransferase (cytosine-N4-specific)
MCQANNRGKARRTRLSRLHPYPAMVADELALDLVAEHLQPASSILDPFCGSGRLLAAADSASVRVGVDANPLAWLLTRAKLAPARATVIRDVLGDLPRARSVRATQRLEPTVNGNVEWFAPDVLADLEKVVAWLNGLLLPEPELTVVASALSATVREVSFARKSGWKLHRLSAEDRASFQASVFERFERRLRYCEKELARANLEGGSTEVHLGDARALADVIAQPHSRSFDLIMTSPPYGDSRTTVQYGAGSALCLSVVSCVRGFEHLAVTGREIDGACLGHRRMRDFRRNHGYESFKPYWTGSIHSPFYPSVAAFLLDYRNFCGGIVRFLKPGGKAILIVGRRSTGGFRLKLDDFTIDELEGSGLSLVNLSKRALHQKRFPRVINRFGRSTNKADRERGRLVTMNDEIILIFRKPGTTAPFVDGGRPQMGGSL